MWLGRARVAAANGLAMHEESSCAATAGCGQARHAEHQRKLAAGPVPVILAPHDGWPLRDKRCRKGARLPRLQRRGNQVCARSDQRSDVSYDGAQVVSRHRMTTSPDEARFVVGFDKYEAQKGRWRARECWRVRCALIAQVVVEGGAPQRERLPLSCERAAGGGCQRDRLVPGTSPAVTLSFAHTVSAKGMAGCH